MYEISSARLWPGLLQADGSTFRAILESLPADPGSLLALALAVGFFGVVVYFGLRGNDPTSPSAAGDSASSAGAAGSSPAGVAPGADDTR